MLPHHRETAFFIDFSPAGEETPIHSVWGITAVDLHRVLVMIVAVFTRHYDLGHEMTGRSGILELITAGANSHVKTGQVRFVIDWQPVVGNIIQIDQPFGLVGDWQLSYSFGQPVNLGLPPFLGYFGGVVIRVSHPFPRVALRVGAAYNEAVADLRSEINAIIITVGHHTIFLVVEIFGEGTV